MKKTRWAVEELRKDGEPYDQRRIFTHDDGDYSLWTKREAIEVAEYWTKYDRHHVFGVVRVSLIFGAAERIKP